MKELINKETLLTITKLIIPGVHCILLSSSFRKIGFSSLVWTPS